MQNYSQFLAQAAARPALTPFAAQNADNAVRPEGPLILIAEDNEGNTTMLSVYLQAKGYRLDFAQHGGMVLERVHAQRPALILMDIQMPVLDGLEATQQLRRNPDPTIANIPIIALTALAMPTDRERALAAGANAYISKPIDFTQLMSLVQQFTKSDDA